MNMQNVKDISIPEGDVRTIHDKDNRLIWGRIAYTTEYGGDTYQDGTPTPATPVTIDVVTGEQTVTITGKNLFDINTFAKGSITVANGVATGTTRDFYVEFQNGIKLTKTAPVMSITATAYHDGASSSGNGIIFRAVYTDGTYNTLAGFQNTTTVATTKTGTTDISKTLDYIDIVYGSGGTNVWHVSNVQVEVGTTVTDYEPYQSSDYEINLGKNLFSGNYSQFDSTGGTGTLYGYFKLPESGDYTFTITAKNDIGAQSPQKFIGFTAQGGSATGGYAWAFAGSTVMQKGDVRSIRNTYQGNRLGYMSMYPNNATILQWFMENFDIQLEVGDTATSYAPYFKPIELCKIGDYQDYIYKSGSDWYVHKAISGVTLNGSEIWTGTGSVFQTLESSTPNKGDLWRAAYSNYFVHHYYPSAITTNIKNGEFGWNGASLLTVRDDNITGSANFKTWLSTHNLDVYYIASTATDTKITDTTLIGQLEAVHEWMTRYGYYANVTGNLPLLIQQTNLS